ncbi:MAG: hypothetical protein WBM38_10990 [Arenicellales bacterium]
MFQEFEEIELLDPLLIEDSVYQSAMTRWEFIEHEDGYRVRAEFTLLLGENIGNRLIKQWSSLEQDENGFITASKHTQLYQDYTGLFGVPPAGKIDMDKFIGLPVMISTRSVKKSVDQLILERDKRYSVVDRVIDLVFTPTQSLLMESVARF